jgi:dephospho-CoA kinase
VRDRGLAPEDADRMIAAQLPAARKRERADVVIENDASLAELEERAAEVWRAIEARARADREGAHA